MKRGIAIRRRKQRSSAASQAPSVEDLLRAAAAELSLSRAIAILDEQRQALRSFGRGFASRGPASRELVPELPPYVMTPTRASMQRARGNSATAPVSLLRYERMAIERALAECGGDRMAAAKLLNSSKSAIYRRMKLLDIMSPAQGGTFAVAPDDPVLAAGEPVSFGAYEKAALVRALDECGGDRLSAAKLVKVGKSTLYRMAKKHGIH
jgi:transcriptional regulator of acetoin/glycerol metabolism